MSEVVQVAIIVGFFGVVTAVVGPLLLARQLEQGRVKALERAEQRQDLVISRADNVARRAAEAAETLLKQNAEDVAARTEVARVARETDQAISSKLEHLDAGQKVIHALVNSSMTAQMQSELDATVRELAGLLEIVELKTLAGQPPTAEALGAIASTRMKIGELQANLHDRLLATDAAAGIAAPS